MSKEIVFDDRQHRTVQQCHRSHRGDIDDTLQDRSLWCCQGVLWNSVGPTLSVPTCRKGASLPFAHPDIITFHKNIFYSDSYTIMWCNTDICGSQIIILLHTFMWYLFDTWTPGSFSRLLARPSDRLSTKVSVKLCLNIQTFDLQNFNNMCPFILMIEDMARVMFTCADSSDNSDTVECWVTFWHLVNIKSSSLCPI